MIIRGKHQERFTAIDNSVFAAGLRPDTLGILCYLISKPPNWTVRVSELTKTFRCGKDLIYRVLNELKAAGYVRVLPGRQDGKFSGTDYMVFDQAQPAQDDVADLPQRDSPQAVPPRPAKPDAYKGLKVSKTESSKPPSKPDGLGGERGTRLPEDWEPNPEELALAGKVGLTPDEIATELTLFRNFWTAKAGRDARKLSWTKTWQNWCINAGSRRGRKPATNKAGWLPGFVPAKL